MKQKEPNVFLEHTGCCAFTQLRVLGRRGVEWQPIEIDELLDHHRASVEEIHSPRRGFGGAPTLFCMTVSPGEKELEEFLASRGFEHHHTLPRRRGYPRGVIKMWMITFPVQRPALMAAHKEEVACT